MDKVLILGSNGFLGRAFSEYVKGNHRSYELIGVDHTPNPTCEFKYYCADLRQPSVLKEVILSAEPEYLVNFCGLTKGNDLENLIFLNAEIPKNIMELLKTTTFPLKNALFLGSAAEYGLNLDLPLDEESVLKPISEYGLSKSLQTEYFKYYLARYDLNICLARPFNIIGPRLPNHLSIASFLRQITSSQNGATIKTGNLDSKRDFLDLKDVIEALWLVLNKAPTKGIYNICKGSSVSMKLILDYMIEKSGKTLKISEEASIKRTNDIPDSFGSYEKIAKNLGWRPKISLQSSLDVLFETQIPRDF